MKLKEISLADFVRQEKVAPKVAEWIRISLECEIATAWDRISACGDLSDTLCFPVDAHDLKPSGGESAAHREANIAEAHDTDQCRAVGDLFVEERQSFR